MTRARHGAALRVHLQQRTGVACSSEGVRELVGAANTRGSDCSIDWGGGKSGSVLSQRLRGACVLCLLPAAPPVTLTVSVRKEKKLLYANLPPAVCTLDSAPRRLSGANFGRRTVFSAPGAATEPRRRRNLSPTCDFVFAANCWSEFWMSQSPQ